MNSASLLTDLVDFFDYKKKLDYFLDSRGDNQRQNNNTTAAEVEKLLEREQEWKNYPSFYRSIEEDIQRLKELRNTFLYEPSAVLKSGEIRILSKREKTYLPGNHVPSGNHVAPGNPADHGFRQKLLLPPATTPATNVGSVSSTRPHFRKNKESRQPSTTKLSSRHAETELQQIQSQEQQFDRALEDLLENRLEQTIEFGRQSSVRTIADYLCGMFGSELYRDSLLSFVQQYALSDVSLVNPQGMTIGKTGFNLSFFGDPGTGKTFAIKDMILGKADLGIKAHGLIGRNRYCGSMTPAKFVRMAEAYQDKKFNFIIPEFDDWFRYKGMINTLKLAMEGGIIEYETNQETIGPYRFGSFLSVNYNARLANLDYDATVSDPHFKAIEDRMLNNLHRLSPERYQALSLAREKIEKGLTTMDLAASIQDHLMLVYAIETEHPFVQSDFPKRNILVTPYFYQQLDDARQQVFHSLREQDPAIHQGRIPFSPRLEKKALQLAGAMTLPGYFNSYEPLSERGKPPTCLPLDQQAVNYALHFFVQEAAVRSKQLIRYDAVPKGLPVAGADEQ